MSLTINSVPEVLFTQSKGDNCIYLTSDSVVQSTGAVYSLSYSFFTFLLAGSFGWIVGRTITLGGITFEMVVGSPATSNEIEYDADATILAPRIQTALEAYFLPEYTIVVTALNAINVQIVITSISVGESFNLNFKAPD